MEYETHIVIDMWDLQEEVHKMLDDNEIDIGEVLFGYEYYNDTYQHIYISDFEDAEENTPRYAVYVILHEMFPNKDKILINTSW